jgi:protein SCO1
MSLRLLSVIIFGLMFGALTGVGVLLLTTPREGAPVGSSGTALIGGPFSLIGEGGKTVTDRDFRGRYMLVYFGYTHCPDICPAELQVMAQALDRLGDKAKKVVPVFITVDPERDTPQAMGEYVKSFRAQFRGADRITRGDCCCRQGLPGCLF